jgi:site-specific DNA-methyltransferase (adenine-specific)
MTVRIEHSNMLEAIPRLVAEGVVCDAVVTDPPYHLTATQKRFSAADAAPAQHGRDGAMLRLSGGFMGQTWDGGNIAFRPETWATVATILRPGAFLVAFGGTRTYHRLACAIEDGGFVIQDCIMWLFATGFPKRRDMLKPAYEPIVLAYKPAGKRTMQIDECRIGWENDAANPATNPLYRAQNGYANTSAPDTNSSSYVFRADGGPDRNPQKAGRWPANVCHDCSAEVLAAFPDSAGQLRSVGPANGPKPSINVYGDYGPREQFDPRGDSGSAARFFFSASPDAPPCDLCGWSFDRGDGIIEGCKPVSNAVNNSLQRGTIAPFGSALSDARGFLSPGNVDRPPVSNAPAASAENPLPRRHPITRDSVPSDVVPWPLERIVQNVRSAAHLCGSCATAIAQSLVASRRGLDPALPPLPASISETSRRILTQSLALYVANRASTDIILTTDSLRLLFGSVLPAIAENINSERSVGKANIGFDQRRFHFSSKAQKSDRWGSRHPTVKPVELMKWLVKLVCPEGGLLLDPFAGSGTTGVAALATGRDCILIEREDAYVADIRERMAHYDGAGRHSMVAMNRNGGRPSIAAALEKGTSRADAPQRQTDLPLFDHRPFDAAADARDSYTEAVLAIGERVKAGAPVPDFFLSERE